MIMTKVSFSDMQDEIYEEFPGAPGVGYYAAFGEPVLFIQDIEIIKRILIKDFDHFVDRRSFELDQKNNKYWVYQKTYKIRIL